MSNCAVWESKLEHYQDSYNTTDVKVSIEKGYEDDMDTVSIGEYVFAADDLIKLASTITHVTQTY